MDDGRIFINDFKRLIRNGETIYEMTTNFYSSTVKKSLILDVLQGRIDINKLAGYQRRAVEFVQEHPEYLALVMLALAINPAVANKLLVRDFLISY
ncbi:MAG: hypothetical protein V1900_02085 [Candidatus Aenigmatarchaeota archaeon]